MNVGALVNWRKQITHPPNPDYLTLPAIVNQIWPDGHTISLFVFSFEGQFLARTVPDTEVDLIADPDQLRVLLACAPTLIHMKEDLEEILSRMAAMEAKIEELETRPVVPANITTPINSGSGKTSGKKE